MQRKLYFGIILLFSALTLLLELLQTRILSVALWFHFVYIVITMALLGFAASGTMLATSAVLNKLNDLKFFSLCIVGFSISAFFSIKFAVLPIYDTFSLSPNPALVFSLIVSYTILMVPYFFAGLIIGGSFMRFKDSTNSLYFYNLVGSGLGCILFVFLIKFLGAAKLLVLVSLISVLPLALIIRKQTIYYKITMLLWLIFMGIALFLPENFQLHKILPESHKQFWTWLPNAQWEYTEWNAISRIDVISNRQYPREKYILMDGDAQAGLFDIGLVRGVSMEQGFVDRNVAYKLMRKAPEDVLIIGAGGAYDVILAILNGAHRVDAVEINPTTAHLISKTYSSHIGNIFQQPNVKLFVEDGRSFVRKAMKKYDIIMMCATDSVLALSTGAYVLSDNYLYTKEAFCDYLDHLSDNGFIQIGRFLYHTRPRETLRIFSTALEVCRDMGYPNPTSNIVVIAPTNSWADVIIKKRPFSEEERNKLKDFCSEHNIKILFAEGIPPDQSFIETAAPFSALAENFKNGQEKHFYQEYDYNVVPALDDKPFFYQYNKWHAKIPKSFLHNYYDRIRGLWHIFILSSLLIHSLILSLFLIILPLIIHKRNFSIRPKLIFIIFLYFAAIGLAFMFIEMSIIQKFVLFLGSPIYSMAITLPAILIFAGLGSLFSARLRNNLSRYMFMATFLCGCIILAISIVIPYASKLFLSQALYIRILITIILIGIPAFFMGMPFPLGLRMISNEQNEIIPWAWAINGSFSVIASILAIILAMQFGFKMVMSAGAFCYFIASLTSLFYLKRCVLE